MEDIILSFEKQIDLVLYIVGSVMFVSRLSNMRYTWVLLCCFLSSFFSFSFYLFFFLCSCFIVLFGMARVCTNQKIIEWRYQNRVRICMLENLRLQITSVVYVHLEVDLFLFEIPFAWLHSLKWTVDSVIL